MTYETKREVERAVLFGIFDGGEAEDNLSELEELAETSGAEVVGYLAQNRVSPHPATYLGKGKIEELAEMVRALDADLVICDDELTPAQLKHIEKDISVKILDRTALILDIFAMRAISAEGKAQVELAQYKYRLSRLTGRGVSMSRLLGGIGVRGPGESKLETDRRHIRRRIGELNAELKEISENRAVMRQKRERNNVPVVSMVGYTNAGKSTLMNYLTNAGVLAEDKLFATLDTTTRKIKVNGDEFLFTDTVGFIQKLPHQLISAFRATLEELLYADVLVHVVDSANAGFEKQMETVYKTLSELKVADKPVVALFNKSDLVDPDAVFQDKTAKTSYRVSAKTGEGVSEFLDGIEKILSESKRKITVLLPYSQGREIASIHASGGVLREEHTEDGVLLTLFAGADIVNKLAEFIV